MIAGYAFSFMFQAPLYIAIREQETLFLFVAFWTVFLPFLICHFPGIAWPVRFFFGFISMVRVYAPINRFVEPIH
jgi:hypothetical protein